MNETTCIMYVTRFVEILGAPRKISINRTSETYEFYYSNFSFTYCPISRIHGYDCNPDKWEIEFYFSEKDILICFRDPKDFNDTVNTLKENEA